jgi:flagellar M-ring protein FliF
VATVPEQAQGEGVLPQAQQPGSSRNQATRNFELDRTISYTRHQMGRVERLSVAVVVDDIEGVDPASGDAIRTQWSENELARLRLLVQDAVGFNARRGDSVNVVNSPFVESRIFDTEDVPIWKQEWVWDIVKQVLAALFVLILVFGILRPILKRLADNGAENDNAGLGLAGDLSAELEGLDSAAFSSDSVTFGADDDLLPTPNESFDYQVNAIRSMIAEDPTKVAQAIKQWIAKDE